MTIRYCPCGREIPPNIQICRECQDIYGIDKNNWPEWLIWQVADIQRELDDDRHAAQIFYDTQAERIVYYPRKSLIEQYDENGYVILRFDESNYKLRKHDK
jgi:hypothetical protein